MLDNPYRYTGSTGSDTPPTGFDFLTSEKLVLLLDSSIANAPIYDESKHASHYSTTSHSVASRTVLHSAGSEGNILIPQVRLRGPRSQIRQFRQLKNNWDGQGASAPSSNAIRSASRLLDLWPTGLMGVPDLSILADGGISLEFFSDSGTLLGVIDVHGDGLASYAFSDGGVGNLFDVADLDCEADREMLFSIVRRLTKF